MRWTRGFTYLAAVAAPVAGALALAAPAHATYAVEPVSIAWHPTGGVHASVTGNGVVYLGGKLDGTGGIAAVNADTGSLLWMVPANNDVRALALSPDGSTLYAGGSFTTVNGVTQKHVAALKVSDHSVVATFKGAAAGTVRDLVARGSDLYVAGKITTVGGVAHRGVGALNAATGKADPAFAVQADNDVLGLALAGTRLILSGSFTHINGAVRNELASIDLSTNTLTSWAPAKLCTACDQYWDVQTDATNAYVATSGNAAGAFNLTTGVRPWRIAGSGDFQAAWLPGDGRVYFGGHFGAGVSSTAAPGTTVNARMLTAVFTASGQVDPAWTPYLYTAYPGVWAFTSSGTKLWVGGDFTGERVGGKNNKQPYVAAYPGI